MITMWEMFHKHPVMTLQDPSRCALSCVRLLPLELIHQTWSSMVQQCSIHTSIVLVVFVLRLSIFSFDILWFLWVSFYPLSFRYLPTSYQPTYNVGCRWCQPTSCYHCWARHIARRIFFGILLWLSSDFLKRHSLDEFSSHYLIHFTHVISCHVMSLHVISRRVIHIIIFVHSIYYFIHLIHVISVCLVGLSIQFTHSLTNLRGGLPVAGGEEPLLPNFPVQTAKS